MGHPFWMSRGRNNGADESLNVTSWKYRGTNIAPLQLIGAVITFGSLFKI